MALLAIGLITLAAPAAANEPRCSPERIAAGLCGSSNTGDDVTIGVDDETPGGPGNGGGGVGNGGGGGGTGGNGNDGGEGECQVELRDECWNITPPSGPEDPVTISDIVRFRPTPEINNMQPKGWMIVGLDTNFYATGGVRVVTGELLGQPASVRFTPIRWSWTYGDGSGTTTSTRGSTWSALKVAEFDKTPTSHIYRRAGTYFIDLTVTYRADYRYAGSPWWPVQGTLALPANRLVATAGSADTVLVEEECTRNPSGPGC